MKGLFSQSVSTICFRSKRMVALVGVLMMFAAVASAQSSGTTPDGVHMTEPTIARTAYTLHYRTNSANYMLDPTGADFTTTTTTTTTTLWVFEPYTGGTTSGQYKMYNVGTGEYLAYNSRNSSFIAVVDADEAAIVTWNGNATATLQIGGESLRFRDERNGRYFTMNTSYNVVTITFVPYTQTTRYTIQINGIGTSNREIWDWDPNYVNPEGTMAGKDLDIDISGHKGGPDMTVKTNTLALHEVGSPWTTTTTGTGISSTIGSQSDKEIPLNTFDTIIWTWDNAGVHSVNVSVSPSHFSDAENGVTHYDVTLTPVAELQMWEYKKNGRFVAYDDYLHVGIMYTPAGSTQSLKIISDKIEYYRSTFHIEKVDEKGLECESFDAFHYQTLTSQTKEVHGTQVKGKRVLDNANTLLLDSTTAVRVTDDKVVLGNGKYQIVLQNEDGSVCDWCRVDTTGNAIKLTTTSANYTYQERRAVLTIQYTYEDTENHITRVAITSVPIRQKHQFSDNQKFYQQKGMSEWPLDQWGGQQVHEINKTVYYISDNSTGTPTYQYKLVPNSIQFTAYQRWYDWDEETDLGDYATSSSWYNPKGGYVTRPSLSYNSAQSFSIINESTGELAATQGYYWINSVISQEWWNYYDITGYVYPVVAFRKDSLYHVACDMSNYTDYHEPTANNDSLIEPTLSVRQVWNFVPAKTRAAQLEACRKTEDPNDTEKFLEDYVLTAPVDRTIFLVPEYCYSSDNYSSTANLNLADLGYIYEDGGKYYHIGASDADEKASWSGGSAVTDSRFRSVSSNTATTIVYTLTTDNYNLCRFTVTFKPTTEVGPSANLTQYTSNIIKESYDLLGELNFDYEPLPGTASYTGYAHPLPLEQSTYAFAYPNSTAKRHYRKNMWQPFYIAFGEYQLINTTRGLNSYNVNWLSEFDQHGDGGAQDGWMLFIDGMETEGLVASLDVDVDLCPGQKLYCSAWVMNAANNANTVPGQTKPILRFVMEGKKQGAATWNALGEYTTGELQHTAGQWQQVVFEIQVQEEYDQYRVSVYNYARNTSGNDFAIDDISIFASRIPLVAYQATTACDDSDSIVAIVRMDYANVVDKTLSNSQVFYDVYREPKATFGGTIAGESVKMDYIHEGTDGVAMMKNAKFGRLHIPGPNFDPSNVKESDLPTTAQGQLAAFQAMLNKYIYNNVALLLEASKHSPDSCWGFVKEGTKTDGSTKYAYYVVHYVPLDGQYEYSVRMSKDSTSLIKSDIAIDCSNKTPLPIANAFDLVLDYDVVDNTQNAVCGNDNHMLSMRLTDKETDSQGNVQTRYGRCMSDWILTGDTTKGWNITLTVDGETISYDYNAILSALTFDLRKSRPDKVTGIEQNTSRFATSLAEISPNDFDGAGQEVKQVYNYQLVKNLVEAGYLILGKEEIDVFVPSGGRVKYLALPIAGTGYETDADGNVVLDVNGEPEEMEICTAPKIIELISEKTTDYQLEVGTAKRADLPLVLQNRPPVVRVSLGELNMSNVELPIQAIKNVQLADSIMLTWTDDPDYDLTTQGYAFTPSRKYNPAVPGDYYKAGEIMNLTVASVLVTQAGKAFTMLREGYQYTFKIELEDRLTGATVADGCPVGATYFTLYIVPDYLVWSPMNSETSDWNNDANWKAANSLGELTGAPGFVPMSHSNVIIPETRDAADATAEAHYPDIDHHATYMADTTNLNTYDVGYQAAHCKNIYIEGNARLLDQHHLQYEKAFVDYDLKSNVWYLFSPALQGMYTGDIFTPNNPAENDKKPFEPSKFIGDRYNDYGYWQSHFNQTTQQLSTNPNRDQTYQANAEWSGYVNDMGAEYEVGKGYAIIGYGPTDDQIDLTVRLPKPDTRYYYYWYDDNSVGYPSNRYFDIPAEKLDVRAKFAFQPENNAMKIKLTYKKETNQVVFGNPTMAYIDMAEFFKVNTQFENNFLYLQNTAWGVATPLITEPNKYCIAPMEAVMLTFAESASSAETEVTLTTDMLTLYQGDVDLNTLPQPQQKPNAYRTSTQVTRDNTSLLTITAVNGDFKSKLYLGESPAANNGVLVEEGDVYATVSGQPTTAAFATPVVLYAVNAGSALSVDIRKNITTVPVSISFGESTADYPLQETTDLWFMGIDQFADPIYLVDSIAGKEYRLLNGLRLRFETSTFDQQRYYIRYRAEAPGATTDLEDLRPSDNSTYGDTSGNLLVNFYNSNSNEVMVTANAVMRHIAIYDIMGRLIAEAQPNDLRSVIKLPTGAYIFRVEAASASTLEKVLVK